MQQLGNGEIDGGIQILQVIVGETETRPLLKQPARAPTSAQNHPIPSPSLPVKAEPDFSPGSSSGPLLPSKFDNISSPASFLLATSLLQGNGCGGFQYLHGDFQALEEHYITAQDTFSSQAQQM